MFLYVVLFHFISCLTCEDDELSHHVFSAEVNAWVWFAISLLLGSAYCLGEWHVGCYLVEDKVERSAENSLYLKYFVS